MKIKEAYKLQPFKASGYGFSWQCSTPDWNKFDLWCQRLTSDGRYAQNKCRGVKPLWRIDLKRPTRIEANWLKNLTLNARPPSPAG